MNNKGGFVLVATNLQMQHGSLIFIARTVIHNCNLTKWNTSFGNFYFYIFALPFEILIREISK